jgi:DedD protein
MANDDQEIQFKKRARRRLIGAVALVLLMVTVLPMILDNREVKTPQQDIAISIPSQDSGEFTSKIIPVAPEQKSSVTVPASSDKKTELQMPVAPKTEVANVEKPKLDAAPVDAKPIPDNVTEKKSTETKVESKPEPVKPVAVVAKPESLVKSIPINSKNAFSVQIGVFSDLDKVKEMQSALTKQGFHPYVEKMSTPKGVKQRLRVGPFANRADAEKARDTLQAAGQAGIVVANK